MPRRTILIAEGELSQYLHGGGGGGACIVIVERQIQLPTTLPLPLTESNENHMFFLSR